MQQRVCHGFSATDALVISSKLGNRRPNLGQKAGEPGLLRTQQDTSQRRGENVHREVSPIKGLYRRLERHWIFYAVGRQVVTENERKIGRTVTQAAGGRPVPP